MAAAVVIRPTTATAVAAAAAAAANEINETRARCFDDGVVPYASHTPWIIVVM